VLVDAGDVIVHLFRPEVRDYYDLEGMWSVEQEIERAGVVVSKFATSSISSAARTSKPERHQQFNKFLVSLDSEIRLEPDMKIMRISESGH
jgi:hypothetical protein